MAANQNPTVENPDDLIQGLDQALSDIQSAISQIKTIGLTDADIAKFVYSYLVIPFDDAGHQIAEVFQPTTQDLQDDEQQFMPQVQEASQNVIQAFNNPIMPLINKQASLFASARQQVEQSIYGGMPKLDPGQMAMVGQLFDQTKTLMRSMFVSGTDSESNMAGIFLYATEETLPQIDLELTHLKKMKALVYTLVEMTSKLPPSFIPEIPSVVAIQKLCDAEQDMLGILGQLNQQQTLDKAKFASAKGKVCAAKEIVKTGGVAAQYAPIVMQLFGFSAQQVQSFFDVQFTPDPAYRANMMTLETLNGYVQDLDPDILALHNNIQTFSQTIAETQQIGIGTIMTQIIVVLKSQIALVRSSLEGQVMTFITQTAGNAPDRITKDGKVVCSFGDTLSFDKQAGLRRSVSTAMDTSGQTINHTVIYAELLALCILMDRTRKLYENVERLLQGQSPIMRTILNATSDYTVDCGPSDGAQKIDEAVSHFLTSANARLSGAKGQNEVLVGAGMDLVKRIAAHEKFLHCIKGNMKNSNEKVKKTATVTLGGSPGVFRFKKSIMNIARKLPQMTTALRQLDLRKLVGIQNVEYTGLNQLMKGLQGVINNCPDQNIKDVIVVIKQQFDDEFALRKSAAITMGSFDEVPAVALKVAVSYRVKAVKQMLDMLQTVHDKFKLPDLCKKAATGVPKPGSGTLSPDVTVAPAQTAPKTLRQISAAAETARKLAAAKTQPFASR